MPEENEPKIEKHLPFDQRLKQHSKLDAIRWQHRRRMAYIALFAMLFVTYWSLFTVTPERLKVLGELVSWFYIVMGSIVGSYVGFSTLDDKWKKDKEKE